MQAGRIMHETIDIVGTDRFVIKGNLFDRRQPHPAFGCIHIRTSHETVFVFGADHIYRMDPRQMVDAHLESGCGVTVAAIPVAREEASAFGVIESDERGRIVAFHEKAENPPTMPGDTTRCLASMGNYVFDTDVLVDIVTPRGTEGQYTDIGSHVIPALTAAGQAGVYDFSRNVVPGQDDRERGYWRDVGTIDAYYEANVDLIRPMPVFNLYNSYYSRDISSSANSIIIINQSNAKSFLNNYQMPKKK